MRTHCMTIKRIGTISVPHGSTITQVAENVFITSAPLSLNHSSDCFILNKETVIKKPNAFEYTFFIQFVLPLKNKFIIGGFRKKYPVGNESTAMVSVVQIRESTSDINLISEFILTTDVKNKYNSSIFIKKIISHGRYLLILIEEHNLVDATGKQGSQPSILFINQETSLIQYLPITSIDLYGYLKWHYDIVLLSMNRIALLVKKETGITTINTYVFNPNSEHWLIQDAPCTEERIELEFLPTPPEKPTPYAISKKKSGKETVVYSISERGLVPNATIPADLIPCSLIPDEKIIICRDLDGNLWQYHFAIGRRDLTQDFRLNYFSSAVYFTFNHQNECCVIDENAIATLSSFPAKVLTYEIGECALESKTVKIPTQPDIHHLIVGYAGYSLNLFPYSHRSRYDLEIHCKHVVALLDQEIISLRSGEILISLRRCREYIDKLQKYMRANKTLGTGRCVQYLKSQHDDFFSVLENVKTEIPTLTELANNIHEILPKSIFDCLTSRRTC